MPTTCTSSSWPFPPQTRELQLDEKWAFVDCKQQHCDLENRAHHTKGDCWDHVAFDPEHRLVLDVEVGKRSSTRIKKLLRRVKDRLDGRVPRLITTDEFAGYTTVLKLIWPKQPIEFRQDKRCTRRRRACVQPKRVDPALTYATVCKQRENGRVVSIRTGAVFGSEASVAKALEQSSVSNTINTSFIERHNGTDRHRNSRKARRTYRFSKDWQVHEAASWLSLYTYNFCWCVRTLAERLAEPKKDGTRYRQRTPAMAAGLTDHVWTLQKWLARPVAGLAN